jgi:hypothetical protein
VPEKSRGLDHALVEALLPDFEVGSAGEGDFDADEHFIFRERRNIDALNFQIFGAVKHGRRHVTVAFYSHSCVITTFRVSSAGRAANSSASAIRSSGNRCEIEFAHRQATLENERR